MPVNPMNPMVVQSDHTVLLEVDNPQYAEARDALARFAELEKSPEHIHTYRLSPLSLWNAAASGLGADGIVESLVRYSKYDVPGNIQADVRDVQEPKCDVLAATNFSWWGFHAREELLGYLRNCRASLKEAGMLMMDIYGGPEAQVLQLEERECEGFTYIWDQDVFSPITHAYTCRIHYRFPDGTELNNAFTYEWRLWTLPEIRDLLAEAGFRTVTVFWEGADEDGEPDGIFVPSLEGDTASAWVAYVVAFV